MTNGNLDNGTNNKVTTIFWVIGVIALLWNLMGVFAFITEMMISEEALALLSEQERLLYEHNPMWHKVVYGIATMSGLLGAVALLMKKRWAVMLFLISLVAVIIQFFYGFFGTNAQEVLGNIAVILPIVVIIIAALLWYYSKKCEQRGWLS
jgi:hypothetical protein